MIFLRIILLVGLLTVSANSISKREDGASWFYGWWSFMTNFQYNDFIALGDPREQHDNLIALAPIHPGIAEYLFTRLLPSQRNHILMHTTQFERFLLFWHFDLNGRVILLKLLPDDEVRMILESQSPDYISRLVEKFNEDDRIDFVKRMGPKAQVKWILGFNRKRLGSFSKYLKSDQNLMQFLAKEFVKVRIMSRDNEKFKNLKEIIPFLDDLAEYYTMQEARTIKYSLDPVFYLSRFTPKERDVFRLLLKPQDKIELLRHKEHHTLQRFPSDFWGDKAKDYGLISSEKEWTGFWNQVMTDVQRHEKFSNLIGQRRQIFTHRSDMPRMGSVSGLPLPRIPE